MTKIELAVATILGQDGLQYTVGLVPERDGSTTSWTVLAYGGEPPKTFDPAVGTFRSIREAIRAIRQAWRDPMWQLKWQLNMIETATPANGDL